MFGSQHQFLLCRKPDDSLPVEFDALAESVAARKFRREIRGFDVAERGAEALLQLALEGQQVRAGAHVGLQRVVAALRGIGKVGGKVILVLAGETQMRVGVARDQP